MSELAPAMRSTGTRSGTDAPMAGPNTAPTLLWKMTNAKSAISRTCGASACVANNQASPSIVAPRAASDSTMIRFRECRSTSVPATGPSSTAGSVEHIMRRPTRPAESVACEAHDIMATRKAAFPSWLAN